MEWEALAPSVLDPLKIPTKVRVKASLPTNTGRPSLSGPGKMESLDLDTYRRERRLQELAFGLARDLTNDYLKAGPHPTGVCAFPAGG